MEDNNKLDEKETKEAASIDEKEKLAYLAGLIDGEGTITLLPTYPDRGIYATYLIVSNSDENLMNWLVKNFGGVIKELKSRKEGSKPVFNWILRTKKAAELIEKCYPYLIVKKLQAEVIFEYRKTLCKPHPTTVEIINKRRELVEKIREMNTGRQWKIEKIERKVILTKCPFCGSINERPEKRRKKGEKLYKIVCKNCNKTYFTDYLGIGARR